MGLTLKFGIEIGPDGITNAGAGGSAGTGVGGAAAGATAGVPAPLAPKLWVKSANFPANAESLATSTSPVLPETVVGVDGA